MHSQGTQGPVPSTPSAPQTTSKADDSNQSATCNDGEPNRNKVTQGLSDFASIFKQSQQVKEAANSQEDTERKKANFAKKSGKGPQMNQTSKSADVQQYKNTNLNIPCLKEQQNKPNETKPPQEKTSSQNSPPRQYFFQNAMSAPSSQDTKAQNTTAHSNNPFQLSGGFFPQQPNRQQQPTTQQSQQPMPQQHVQGTNEARYGPPVPFWSKSQQNQPQSPQSGFAHHQNNQAVTNHSNNQFASLPHNQNGSQPFLSQTQQGTPNQQTHQGLLNPTHQGIFSGHPGNQGIRTNPANVPTKQTLAVQPSLQQTHLYGLLQNDEELDHMTTREFINQSHKLILFISSNLHPTTSAPRRLLQRLKANNRIDDIFQQLRSTINCAPDRTLSAIANIEDQQAQLEGRLKAIENNMGPACRQHSLSQQLQQWMNRQQEVLDIEQENQLPYDMAAVFQQLSHLHQELTALETEVDSHLNKRPTHP